MIQMIRHYFYLYRAYKERKAQEQLRREAWKRYFANNGEW